MTQKHKNEVIREQDKQNLFAENRRILPDTSKSQRANTNSQKNKPEMVKRYYNDSSWNHEQEQMLDISHFRDDLTWFLPYEPQTRNGTPLVFFLRAKYKQEYIPECYDESDNLVYSNPMVVKMYDANQKGSEESYSWLSKNIHKMDFVFKTVNLYVPSKYKSAKRDRLKAVVAFHTDLDIGKKMQTTPWLKEQWQSYDDNGKATFLIGECMANGLPEPNHIQLSGNGAHLFWFLDKPLFIKRYRKKKNFKHRDVADFADDMNSRIATRLEYLGGDNAVATTTSVLRLSGTYNHKNNTVICRTIHRNTSLYSSDDIFTCLVETQEERELSLMSVPERCAYKRLKVEKVNMERMAYKKKLKADKKRKKKSERKGTHKSRFSKSRYCSDVISDLRTLANIRYGGEVTKGNRDKFAHIATSVISSIAKDGCELLALAQAMISDFMPKSYMNSKFIEHSMSAVKKLNNEPSPGPYMSHRYNYSIDSIIRYLEISDSEQVHLACLISRKKKRNTYNIKRSRQRREYGSRPREKYIENSITQLKPWNAYHKSRAGWYRQTLIARSMQISLLRKEKRLRQVRLNYNIESYNNNGNPFMVYTCNPLSGYTHHFTEAIDKLPQLFVDYNLPEEYYLHEYRRTQ